MGVNVVYLTLLEFSILVTAAEALSLILNRYRYPSIVGELLTGIALSPYALGGLLNTVLKVDLFSINEYIIFLSEFSVVLLLFASGLEHGLSSLRQGGLMGLMAAVAGAVAPYVIVFEYAVNAGFNPGAASLIALTTAPTSLAVVAGVVEREGLQRHPSTGVLIAAASVDDVVALIMLSLVLMSPGSSSGMVWRLVRIVALWVIFLTASILIVPRLLNRLNEHLVIYASLVVLFGLVVAMTVAGFSAVIAAFIAGVAVAESRVSGRIRESAGALLAIFGSIFFITIGLQMNLKTLTSLNVIAQSLAISTLAILAKMAGVYPFAYAKLRNTSHALSASLGMVPRGEMGLVVASIGLSGGVINQGEYSIALLMVLVTTIIGSITYRRSVK
ncbi:MAG: cation:proton antiporter [Caldivirga sp.]|nr:cation:proton antiporter [Caldivirga sp.]